MVNESIVKSIQDYLRVVTQKGVPVKYGVLFGSYAAGRAHEWSDIDLLVVSPVYDEHCTHDDWADLWVLAAHTNYRIEPIPVGEKQFKEDRSILILDVARREGQIIPLAE